MGKAKLNLVWCLGNSFHKTLKEYKDMPRSGIYRTIIILALICIISCDRYAPATLNGRILVTELWEEPYIITSLQDSDKKMPHLRMLKSDALKMKVINTKLKSFAH